MAYTLSYFLGTHNDARLAGQPVIYGQGSYIPHPIPQSFGYVYYCVHNNSSDPVYVQTLQLCLTKQHLLPPLELPATSLQATPVMPNGTLVLGFLEHLLLRTVRYHAPCADTQSVTGYVTLSNGECLISPAHTFDLRYPASPLQDVELLPYADFFLRRTHRYEEEITRIHQTYGSLSAYANLHHSWGMHQTTDVQGSPCWVLREYMPTAQKLWITTNKLKFQRHASHAFTPLKDTLRGWWELTLPLDALQHGDFMELRVIGRHATTAERRVPAMARYVEQDKENLGQWCAKVWLPPQYTWRHPRPQYPDFPRIYEAHIGMAQDARNRAENGGVGTFNAFTDQILPRIKAAGYTTVQLMGVIEHPLYKSFGYQVSSYFATTSRCGTPEDFKRLVDTAHGLGLAVILDIPHSHSCPNTEQGIARYDTSSFLFDDKNNQWGTLSFDYSNEWTRRFLLSNCRFWLEEYMLDGFRFDAVGNILYTDHGFGDDFGHVGRCFYDADGQLRANEDGLLHLTLTNALIHECLPQGMSIAEEFSGMPGLTAPAEGGGLGFDYRFAMGIPDFWAKFIKKPASMGQLWYEMTNHRSYDATISYMECHDQCINGKDAMIWRLIGDSMYTHMGRDQHHIAVDRGVALYKIMRMVTLSTAHCGYLNFMGAEFGHPEWLDEAAHAHRQWDIADNTDLKYAGLAMFDKECLQLVGSHLHDIHCLPVLRLLDETGRLLAFERGHLLFVFNFHETQAAPHTPIMVSPGKYVERMSTDAVRYAGFGNLEASGAEHFSDPASGIDPQRICLYLPPLTALVLEN